MGLRASAPLVEQYVNAVELADVKLYEAKAAGRNCWRSARLEDTDSLQKQTSTLQNQQNQ